MNFALKKTSALMILYWIDKRGKMTIQNYEHPKVYYINVRCNNVRIHSHSFFGLAEIFIIGAERVEKILKTLRYIIIFMVVTVVYKKNILKWILSPFLLSNICCFRVHTVQYRQYQHHVQSPHTHLTVTPYIIKFLWNVQPVQCRIYLPYVQSTNTLSTLVPNTTLSP